MFEGCKSLVVYSNAVGKNNFNATWFDTSKCETMARLFFGCSKIESLNLEGWTVPNVTDMNNMFAGCSNLENPFSGAYFSWDTTKVTNMSSMFEGCSSLDDISVELAELETTNVTDMSRMFAMRDALTKLDVSTWNVSNVSDMTEMFQNCGNITTIYAKDPTNWQNESKTTIDKSINMFDACVKLKGHEAYQEGTTTYKNDISKAHTGWYFTKK
ncbi:MAG: BspA family leucine-rich repeat surface protein [Spirochaetaceae bacterium]|nr:BspA family leucine-rich repeat surface protein [Spirochaetaceae bacterium]